MQNAVPKGERRHGCSFRFMAVEIIRKNFRGK